jgi:hypothetical protein
LGLAAALLWFLGFNVPRWTGDNEHPGSTYSRRAPFLTVNAGDDALAGWVALKEPKAVNASAQRIALVFNREREDVSRTFNEGLRADLQSLFNNGVERPRSIGALIRHYAKNEDFLYEVVNPIYERAVGKALPREELWDLLNSMNYWRMFLAGYVCAIYQRAVRLAQVRHYFDSFRRF